MDEYLEIEKLIDEQIRDLNELKRLARNPGMLAFIRQVLAAKQPNNSFPSQQAPAPKAEVGRQFEVIKTLDADIRHQRADKYYGELSQATEDAVKGFERRPFTIRDIVDEMTKRGYAFRAKDPRVAVSGVLTKLIGKQVEVLEQGAGKRPTVFRNLFDDQLEDSLVAEKHA